MTEITVKQMPNFIKAYKKLHTNKKTKVNEAIKIIISNPEVGQLKKGDLAGVYVYKFKIHETEYLLAYAWSPKTRLLLALGVHENFYRKLKQNH